MSTRDSGHLVPRDVAAAGAAAIIQAMAGGMVTPLLEHLEAGQLRGLAEAARSVASVADVQARMKDPGAP